jgi:D-aspartate ligase
MNKNRGKETIAELNTGRMNTAMTKAIVFGGSVGGLAVIRSLGRRGIPVIAVGYDGNALGFSSRYSCDTIISPDAKIDADKFLSFMLERSKEWAGSMLIPMSDEILTILSYHKEQLSEYYVVTVPDWAAVRQVVDKEETYKLAARLGVPIPKTVPIDSNAPLERVPDGIGYPFLLKPRRGHEFTYKFSRKAFIIEDSSQLQASLTEASREGCDMLIQEIIPGGDDQLYAYIAYYDKEGIPLAEFTGRKLRQNPPFLGIGRVVESTQTEEILAPSREIIKGLSWTGICAFEYKKDARDGRFKLLEINGRSFLWIGLPTKCGVDLPWIMYNDLVWNKKLPVSGYKTGVKWIDEAPDIVAAIRHPRREKALTRKYFSPYFSDKTFALFVRDDWKPALMEWRRLFLSALKKIFKYASDSFKKPSHP